MSFFILPHSAAWDVLDNNIIVWSRPFRREEGACRQGRGVVCRAWNSNVHSTYTAEHSVTHSTGRMQYFADRFDLFFDMKPKEGLLADIYRERERYYARCVIPQLQWVTWEYLTGPYPFWMLFWPECKQVISAAQKGWGSQCSGLEPK